LWSSYNLNYGEFGLNVDTSEVKIGTADNQEWSDAFLLNANMFVVKMANGESTFNVVW
jgi:hypothetical protein